MTQVLTPVYLKLTQSGVQLLLPRIVVECYSGLYEEGEVEHINGPTLSRLVGTDMHSSPYLG